MKKSLTLSILFISIIAILTSCKKTINDPVENIPDVTRKIRFQLYTDKDVSTDNDSIRFVLTIQKLPNLLLWDSVVGPMLVQDIPSFSEKLVVDRAVPDNDPSLLKVGFIYSIENTGISSHFEYSEAGQSFKVVDFNFQ